MGSTDVSGKVVRGSPCWSSWTFRTPGLMGIALIYPAGKENTYPTKRESWKIIYSNISEGWGHVSSQEDMDFNLFFLFAKLLEGCIAKVANDTSNVKMPLFPPRLPIWTNFWRWRQKQRSGFGHDTVVMVWLINQPHQDVPPQIRPCERRY